MVGCLRYTYQGVHLAKGPERDQETKALLGLKPIAQRCGDLRFQASSAHVADWVKSKGFGSHYEQFQPMGRPRQTSERLELVGCCREE